MRSNRLSRVKLRTTFPRTLCRKAVRDVKLRIKMKYADSREERTPPKADHLERTPERWEVKT
jgi:hypothetical protein